MNINVGTIGVVIIALGILGFLYWRKRSDEKGKEEIKKFLDSLYADFETIIVEYINKIDTFNVDNLMLIEQEAVDNLIDVLWIKSAAALEDYVTDPINKALIKKLLVRERIEEFIREIFEKSLKVQTVYTAKYNNAIIEANREAILLEAQISKNNDNIDKNIPEDFRYVEDIDPTMIINAEGKVVIQEIVKPREEESEEVDPKDSSIEILDK